MRILRATRNARVSASGRGGLSQLLSRTRAVLESRGAGVGTLAVVVAVGVLGWLQMAPKLLLVPLLLGAVLYEFQKRIDQGLPLMQLSALLAVLQWTVGALFAFRTDLVEGRYAMYVEEDLYYSYALPGTCAYVFGLLAVGSSVRQRPLLRFANRDHFPAMGFALNFIAIAAGIVAPSVPSSLAFAVYVFSQLGYIGGIYFLFSRSPFRWPLFLASYITLFRGAAAGGYFHDAILWIMLVFSYAYGLRRRDATQKALILTVAALCLFTLQGIKQDYRNSAEKGGASLLDHMAGFWTSSDNWTSRDMLSNVVTRLNQGWIASAVMNHVPAKEPFCEGETVKDALVSSLLPRFLFPNKKQAGGQDGFMRFTGLEIDKKTTSMAISPLGEAYANYGPVGGILTMLLFGLFFSTLYAFMLRYAVRQPTFLFWIPLIFYQGIKAETEFLTVMNQIVKGTMVGFFLHWALDLTFFSHIYKLAARKRNPWQRGVAVGGGDPGGAERGGEEIADGGLR
jgi:hypothetical protein